MAKTNEEIKRQVDMEFTELEKERNNAFKEYKEDIRNIKIDKIKKSITNS